ncbi:MAG: zinc-dependent metalloprotease [Phycisphaerales bacterium]|nr:zinc-dependent metalloprotease [Phycisphaerales bacterium]
MSTYRTLTTALLALAASALVLPTPATQAQEDTTIARPGMRQPSGDSNPEFPKFEEVTKNYNKVISSADGDPGMYTIYRDKEGDLLAELPRNFSKQKIFLAYTIKGGVSTSGVQTGDMYAYWKQFGKQLALVEPNYATRSTGDAQSKSGHKRVYTDRVILDVPILTMGPGGGPVINLSDLFLGRASNFFGSRTRGANTKLAKTVKAKSFPSNVELAFEMPLSNGRFGTIYYSLAEIPENTGYKPREADERIGYFVTSHRDIGNASEETPYVRYINRWHVEKADPSLQMSPPKKPIVFYIEHTTPVRYRRWVRDGILEWNKAFEKVGIVNAIEVYQQDQTTGAHMEKDPEDARYNFILWTNSGMGFAIGPSRVHPKTGQILDADIVMDEGFITGWVRTWQKLVPQTAMENFGPLTLKWLEDRPDYDPRVRLVDPSMRETVLKQLAVARASRTTTGHPAFESDPTLLGDDEYDGLVHRISQVNGSCQHCAVRAMDVAMFRLNPELFQEQGSRKGKRKKKKKTDDAAEENPSTEEVVVEVQKLDGVPEYFIGPMLRDVIMHEVGHTLGLRHNFKASTIYSLEEMNEEGFIGTAQAGSVMDYMPVNINTDEDAVQGDYTMVTIGPYDYWAIEYGYTNESLEPILARVAEPQLIYATDEDTGGPDPRARRFDHGKNPLNYTESQMKLVRTLREKILEEMVEDGDSWAKARRAYEMLLNKHVQAVSIASNWVGGSKVNRDKKGDPGNRPPIAPIEAEQQRRALQVVLDNTMYDEAFGLSPELLRHMTVDRWFDGSSRSFSDETWPVHSRISGIQASALSQLMNPTTMNRIHDNEFRALEDEDVVTMPEVLDTVHQAVWTEIYEEPNDQYDARSPYITSLRRNLQREHLERLIDMSMPANGFGSAATPVQNLSRMHLQTLRGNASSFMNANQSTIDPYTKAHLKEVVAMIDRVRDAQYIYNSHEMGGGGGPITISFPGRGEVD